MKEQTTDVVFLKSKRVVLRPVMREDVPLLIKWINDPDVRKYLSAYMPMMEADEDEWFENLHKRKPGDIILTIVVDGKAIGTMGIHKIDTRNRTAETGALIGEKEYWGKGYGSEAKMLLLNYAFNTLNLRRIGSSLFEFNERSYKYSLKCGYKEEGRRRKRYFVDGKYWDEILLAVFREDWLPLWEKFAKENEITTF